MKKQNTQRKHNFPDADLCQQSLERIQLAVEDLIDFEQYGFSADRLQDFKGKCLRFQDLPNDDELVGDQMILTQKKYEAADRLKNSIRSIMTRVAMKFSNRTGRYRKFGTAKMNDMTDAQLLFCARRVVRVARQQQAFLEEVGINNELLDKVNENRNVFEDAMHRQQDRVADRDISVEQRIKIGNDIYDEMVNLCTIGKDIWRDKNPQRYELYCIYESNNDQKIARKRKDGAKP